MQPVRNAEPEQDTSTLVRYLHTVAHARRQRQEQPTQQRAASSSGDWLRSLAQHTYEQSDDGTEARRRYMQQLRAYQRAKYGDWQ